MNSAISHRPHRELSARPYAFKGIWLCLFAMLMIFVGPLISQTLPMAPSLGMSMQSDMPMDMSVAMDTATDMQSGHNQAHDHHSSDSHAMWEKCGYCSLLFHSPATGNTASFAIFSLPPPALGRVPASLSGYPRPLAHFIVGPRAPPFRAQV